ncbi:reverse transcriptase domain-containing protein [Tanacetum coccineum]
MTDSQSPEEGVRRAIPEYRVAGLQKGSVTSFPPNNNQPTSTFISQIGSTSRATNINPNEMPESEKKPYPSSLLERTSASAAQQMTQNQKRSSEKQNLSTNRKGKRKSRDVEELEQARQVRHRTVIKMIRGNTNRKRPREQSEQWTSNEISFHSIPGCQLVNSPIILEALIEGFRVCMIYVDGGSSSEVMYEHCLRSLGAVASTIHSMIKFPTANGIATMTTKKETLQECLRMEEAQGPAMERRTIPPRMQASESEGTTSKGKEGSRGQTNKTGEPDDIIQPSPISSKKYTQADEKGKEEDKSLEKLPGKIDWKIESLMGFKYKCLLDAYKGYHQIQMAKKDEEKMAFHTDEGVFCYTKMPLGLEKCLGTYQRLVDTIFEGQMGRNLQAYVDDMVIKSKTELEMIKDVEETLLTLKKLSGKLAALNRFLSKAAERALSCLDTLKKYTNKKEFHWTTEAEEAFQAMMKLIAELPTLTAPKKEKELMVYLSAANKAVSVVLLVERDGRQTPIHYTVKKILLRPYNQGYHRQANKPNIEQSGGNGKIGQVGNTMTEDNPTQVKTDGPDDTLAEGESMEEQEDPKTKTPKNLRTETDIWKLYTDGASNEHGSGAGLILIHPEGAEYSYVLRLNFANSNNDAEYEALLAGLRITTKMKWGMDIVRPLPEAPSKIKFKVPATVIIDNETQLINDPFKSWAEGLGIKLVSTSVYHPQANGVVNELNRSIMQGIKTRLHQEGGTWVEELPNVLWAHRTTPKTSNGETPFSLAYEALGLNLNLLEEQREIAAIKEARRKQQVEKYYNQRVHHKQFKVGEFILWKNELSKVENTGKLRPKWEGPSRLLKHMARVPTSTSMDGAEIPRTWHSSNLRKYYM